MVALRLMSTKTFRKAMSSVLLFSAKKAFHSEKALRAYLHPSYSRDGDMMASDFMREVGLKGYEPMCIEAVREPRPTSLKSMLAGFSYSEQWAHLVAEDSSIDTIVLVYSPNIVTRPEGALRLKFHAAFPYSSKR